MGEHDSRSKIGRAFTEIGLWDGGVEWHFPCCGLLLSPHKQAPPALFACLTFCVFGDSYMKASLTKSEMKSTQVRKPRKSSEV